MQKRIGVFLCKCGGNISDVVDLEEVKKETEINGNVVHSEIHESLCSKEGQQRITETIEEENLNGVVVGSCSPHFHGEEFRRAVEKTHLSPYQLEIANLREQNSWVHYDE